MKKLFLSLSNIIKGIVKATKQFLSILNQSPKINAVIKNPPIIYSRWQNLASRFTHQCVIYTQCIKDASE